MARCPECGGSVTPVDLVKVLPAQPVGCRWCRARLKVPWWSQVAAGLLFVAGSLVAGWVLGRWYIESRDPLALILIAAAVLGLAGLAILTEWVLPLQTLVPRDFRDWKNARAFHENSVDEDALDVEDETADAPPHGAVDEPPTRPGAHP
jgi:hypothetical protein